MQIIDYLVKQLRGAAAHNAAVQIAPAVVLWTDETKQWQSAMPVIKQYLPELIELGAYNPDERVGPAIWVKCMLARSLPDYQLPEGQTPILYLPGVNRKDLRAIDHCPEFLRPLAELQYRGTWWAYNTAGRDWSVGSFLTNKNVGLELDLAKDSKTQDAMLTVISELLESQVNVLQGKRLEAADFLALVAGDPIKDLLSWMNAPERKRQQWPDAKWKVFKDQCKQQFGLDPESSLPEQAIALLCKSEGLWSVVWERFNDTAHHLPDLVQMMLSVTPPLDDLFITRSHYASINKEEESYLQTALASLSNASPEEVRARLYALEKEHAERRQWLWCSLGLSPWASILEPLCQVAKMTEIVFSGPSPQAMAQSYQETFWHADAAALSAMSLAKEAAAQQIVADILAIIYTPWLASTTLNFQRLVEQSGYPGSREINEASAVYQVNSQALFFVDGLRFDTAHLLISKLSKLSVDSQLKTQWAALPSLTATAKAAVTPVGSLLTGQQDNQDFIPVLAASGQSFSSHHFKQALADAGWQYLDGLDTGDSSGFAWLQSGDLDNLGHAQQRKLPLAIDAVLDEVSERVASLLAAGWQHVRIVTDHGWLWVPDGLPKADINKNMTTKRLARCAILKDNVQTEHLKSQWYWNPNVTIAMAPGIAGFVTGDHYNHGGISLQECLIPVIDLHIKQ